MMIAFIVATGVGPCQMPFGNLRVLSLFVCGCPLHVKYWYLQ